MVLLDVHTIIVILFLGNLTSAGKAEGQTWRVCPEYTRLRQHHLYLIERCDILHKDIQKIRIKMSPATFKHYLFYLWPGHALFVRSV